MNKNGRSTLRRVKLGRYPFAAAVERYMRAKEPVLSVSTADEISRKLKLFCRIFDDMKKDGTVSS
ncbi:MAG: hypothetical protein LKJ94_05660 [Candidatus Methanomethylophilus sp.]|nr:hypothetical protein [Methanomethylophilus sp.]MCI2092508.1 hypothetical protein [Methanomethylophilus sp.]